MGRAIGCSGRCENHCDFQSVGLSFSFPALVTDKAKRVERVPSSKGIKKAPASFPGASSRVLKSKEGSLLRRSDAIPKQKPRKSDRPGFQKMRVVVQKKQDQISCGASFDHCAALHYSFVFSH